MLAVIIDVLKKLLSGEFLASADHLGDAAVTKIELPYFPAFAFEIELQGRALDVDMAIFEGSQAIAFVGARIFVAPDADQRRFKQMHHCRQNLLPRQSTEGQV